MAITPGSRIGPYEVISQLGEGGMGVVYRGRDSRLQRDVALKVLPDNFASDPDRMSRFQREAQVLASLNHAHIAQIYGLEQVEGAACIVMELVEGETLEEKLRKGPLSYDEAIDYSKQIADALAAAHERGVVHRELKPANIKIMSNGTVKVLDFGLAKALGPKTSDTNITALPTMASGSMVGAIVGTPGYMSPEQARGKDVDARTDIWAFGCVLYEMLTGKQAFSGETVTDIMAKIVTSPPDLEQLPTTTPSSLRLLLSSVLNKNSTQRLQHIGDTRLFLDGSMIPAEAKSTDAAPAKSSVRSKLAIAALALVAIGLAVPAVLYFRKAPNTAAAMRFDLMSTGGVVPSVSPDGNTFAYNLRNADGKQVIWLKPVGSDAATQVPGTEGVTQYGWSIDSKRILFLADGKLKKVDAAGGTPQVLGSYGQLRGASWGTNGIILLGRASDGIIVKIPEAGGEATPVTKLEHKQVVHALPVFLPDQKHFVYVAGGAEEPGNGIFVASLDGNAEPTRVLSLTPNNFPGMAYLPSGYLVYSNDRKIIAQPFNASSFKVEGEPTTLAEDVLNGGFSVSDNLLFYRKNAPDPGKQLSWFSRDGKPGGPLGAAANYGNLDISPKGDRAAVDINTDGKRDIWIIDLERAVPQRITFDGNDWSTTWSPDGSRIVYAVSRNGKFNEVVEKSSTGAGAEKVIDLDMASSIPVHWSSDNKYLIFSRLRMNGNGFEPYLLPLTGERKPQPFLPSPYDRIQARISPDSHYVAYTTNESGTFQIVVQTFPDPTLGKWPISAEGGVEPKWRRDGRELYYLGLDGKLMSVSISGPAFSAGKPTVLFQTPLTVNKGNPTRDRRYDVTPEGKFLFVVPAGASTAPPITALVNWNAALKK
jgi:Tol biopolymer transport system component/predicted Ser/Thr protein kinase